MDDSDCLEYELFKLMNSKPMPDRKVMSWDYKYVCNKHDIKVINEVFSKLTNKEYIVFGGGGQYIICGKRYVEWEINMQNSAGILSKNINVETIEGPVHFGSGNISTSAAESRSMTKSKSEPNTNNTDSKITNIISRCKEIFLMCIKRWNS